MAAIAGSEYPLDASLLPGEDPLTSYPEDARQWVTVYSELTDFVNRSLTRLDADGRLALGRADRGQLEAQRRSLESRLAYWRQRAWSLGGLEFDPEGRRLRHNGNEAVLTRREAQLFTFLSAHPGQYISAERLKAQAWHAPYLSEEQLRSYVARLRARVRELRMPASIRSQTGRGYALVLEPEA
jgi:DNA-binding response OmpR family regulator